ncbi:MAG: DNA-processing protein DprA [bacterium]|nr:DNA-processing protein DprA [bacterium]
MDPQLAPWIGLAALTDEIGSVRLWNLIQHCGSPAAAFAASHAQLAAVGIAPDTASLVLERRAHLDIPHLTAAMLREEIVLIPRTDPRYPPLLAHIPDPPLCLFVRGTVAALGTQQIALVGTRSCTDYGLAATRLLTAPLARAGLTITSGLALGIDGAAHRVCLEAGGRTIAVLGTGVDDAAIYPAAHRGLAREILRSGGALVSEYVPGTAGRKMHFPARNRIVAGLTIATIVVECPRDSGALITARFALDFGREVFAVPGPITAEQSAGPLAMLKSGATPITRAADVVEALHLDQLFDPAPTPQHHLTGIAAHIVNALSHLPSHIDDIGAAVHLPAHELASHLTSLELDGVVRDVGGSRYVKT